MRDSCPPLYRPELERDACGVGLVADARGRRSHAIVERALDALGRLAHRGAAVEACPDGAGILTQIPWTFFARELPARTARDGDTRMVGMFFWPSGAKTVIVPAIERAIVAAGWRSIRWRPVPVDDDVLDPIARASRPEIWQAIGIADGSLTDADARLHRARLRIERYASRLRLTGFSVVSLSTSTVVYKGLVTPDQLPGFYKDLRSRSFESALAIVHQRFSTNTAPEWRLAQPFRMLAHNGEINTIQGNRIWMRARARDRRCLGPCAGERILDETGSDSQSLDEAVEILRHAGFSLPHAISRLVPPAWEQDAELPPDVAAFYGYQACFSEPWDGPAAIAFTDGRVAGAALDRNGFRPLRYIRTADHQLLLGSEAGIFDVAEPDVFSRGRVGPGGMIAVDTACGTIRETAAIRAALAKQRPYARLLARVVVKADRPPRLPARPRLTDDELTQQQRQFAYTREEIELILRPMAEQGEEAVGSMGDDAPPAAMSSRPRILPDFFRQRFAQVTNPPMDPTREACAMSLGVLLGARPGYLDEMEAGSGWPESGGRRTGAGLLALPSPILTERQFHGLSGILGEECIARLALTFPASDGKDALEAAVERLVDDAAAAVQVGARLLVLTDREDDPTYAPIPPLLGTAAVHHGLAARGLRMSAGIVVETGEARDPHQIATLLAYGAGAVFPYLAYATVASLATRREAAAAVDRYRHTLERGLLKICSKMGVSTIAGYCGGQLFEILGLDRALVDRFFPGTPSPLGGLTLADLTWQILERRRGTAAIAFPGFHTYRRDGEYHANNPAVVRQLHRAAGSESEEAYGAFARLVSERPPTSLRDLLEFRAGDPVPIDEVEPADEICRRFFASAMSVGALSPEAHRAIAIAMNRLGGRSNSGEGGEEPERFRRRQGLDWSGSAIKQIASARFGVTPAYLVSANEIQIKIAQGSKPGEGGQLPAAKVVDHIARLRHAQSGITLISPPVHHDIYSIEDLAQLVFDLRQLHPAARIGVKLVAQTGVGIVAAGVVKAGADAVQISGHDGGTGASPRASIKHAGMPWELGLAEARQVLEHHSLRQRVRLQVDGGLKIGRDVVIAAALGADEFGFGTAAVVAIGCVMARQCHLNTCPVGIATQRPDLRGRFAGTPEMLVTYFRMVAEDVRRQLARLGIRRVDDLIGRVERLASRPAVSTPLDVTPLLATVQRPPLEDDPKGSCPNLWHEASALAREINGRTTTGDDAFRDGLLDTLSPDHPLDVCASIRNTDRAFGTRLAGAIATRFGDAGLPEGSVRIALSGSAGQSFGAFLVPGIRLHLVGEANDYVGKGMHGGEIVISPRSHRGSTVLAGNTVLYGATGGRLFIAGAAGERFAVRNSGATAVVEGVGDHGCEYMTGGRVVVLGATGRNFAAGMSGGMAFVLDGDGRFPARCNPTMVDTVALDDDDWDVVAPLLMLHYERTSSPAARELLDLGSEARAAFWKVVPKGIPAPREREEPAIVERLIQVTQAAL